MNFQDLLTKIRNIDEGTSVEECGMPMPLSGISIGGPRPEQADSVTMNVSMNGSGAGGIRDLMGILKNIEDRDHSISPADMHGDDEIIIGSTSKFDSQMQDLEDGYANEPNPTTTGTNIIDGDDLASDGREAHKVNGGGNPMHESLVEKLSAMYNDIKEAKEDKFDALKHVKDPTKGEKTAAKDVKRGSYADRAAMLKSAEADGRLKG